MTRVNSKARKDNSNGDFDYPGDSIAICKTSAIDPLEGLNLSSRFRTVAVITNGSSVPGLGDIGPLAALPLVEAKCRLINKMSDLTAMPLAINSSGADETIRLIDALSPSLGAVNLEAFGDAGALIIKRRVSEAGEIPIYLDSLDGLPVICLAALHNALKVVEKKMTEVRIVIAGGAITGLALVDFLRLAGASDVVVCDRLGAIHRGRSGPTNWVKEELASKTNPRQVKGSLPKVTSGSDVLILLSDASPPKEITQAMAPKAIILNFSSATSNSLGGPLIYASVKDVSFNLLTPALIFSGLLKGVLEAKARQLNAPMKMAAAMALAHLVPENCLSSNSIVPALTKPNLVAALSEAVAAAAAASGASRLL
ncbi:MAG: hypothetical protein LBE31_01445 [Deltaproteobacteria bacterium]|jgi:malate dehydrogenase (oxaloacetate-decarboxylating)|nr:hypothetical protein [Deltaproteobacteria bacterium]